MEEKVKGRRRVFKKKETKKNDTRDYNSNFKIEKLFVSFVIVNRYQGEYFVNEFLHNGCAMSYVMFGKGTAPSEMLYALGVPESKKDIVFTVFKESQRDKINEIIEQRFNFSKTSKGISFVVPLDSVMGVLSYRFLSDTKVNRRKENGKDGE